MSTSHLRCLALCSVACTLTLLLTGCVLTGGGYYEGEDIGAAYYEPYGVVYDWGPRYHVAPYRGDHHPSEGGREFGRESKRAYRPAPASRPVPSIPSLLRSGGSHSGGSRSGGSRSGGPHPR